MTIIIKYRSEILQGLFKCPDVLLENDTRIFSVIQAEAKQNFRESLNDIWANRWIK